MMYYLTGDTITDDGTITQLLAKRHDLDEIIKMAESIMQGYLGSPRLATDPNFEIIKGTPLEASIKKHSLLTQMTLPHLDFAKASQGDKMATINQL